MAVELLSSSAAVAPPRCVAHRFVDKKCVHIVDALRRTIIKFNGDKQWVNVINLTRGFEVDTAFVYDNDERAVYAFVQHRGDTLYRVIKVDLRKSFCHQSFCPMTDMVAMPICSKYAAYLQKRIHIVQSGSNVTSMIHTSYDPKEEVIVFQHEIAYNSILDQQRSTCYVFVLSLKLHLLEFIHSLYIFTFPFFLAVIASLVATRRGLILLTSNGVYDRRRSNCIISYDAVTDNWTLLNCNVDIFDFQEATCTFYEYSCSSSFVVIARGRKSDIVLSATTPQYSRNMVIYHVEGNTVFYPDLLLPSRPINLNFEYDERACIVQLELESNFLVYNKARVWAKSLIIPTAVMCIIVRYHTGEAMVVVTAQEHWSIRLDTVLQRYGWE